MSESKPVAGLGPEAGPKVRVENVCKQFRRTAPGFRLRTLKSALVDRNLVGGLSPEESIQAVRNVSFEVAAGEAFGLIGSNGSGKSTLLKLLAGILQPTSGRVLVDGRVAALIELGAGFHPEISGRENIFINGAVLGLSRRQIEERYDDIVAFSGLEDFVEEPVKNYSSGMYVRLGFAVAVHTDPDVLMVDEVLSVGDEAFAHRCLHRIEELLSRGKTLLFVSHSLTLVEDLCDRVLWMDRGQARLLGEPRRVVDAYRESVAEAEGRRHLEAKEAAEEPNSDSDSGAAEESRRWGSGEARILRARLLARRAGGSPGSPPPHEEAEDPTRGPSALPGTLGGLEPMEERYHLHSGEDVTFELEVTSPEGLEDVVVGIGIATPRGVEIWGTNTDLAGWRSERFEGTTVVRIECPRLRLAAGEYRLDLAVHARDGAPYDYRQGLFSFSVTAPQPQVGPYAVHHRWHFGPEIRWAERGDGVVGEDDDNNEESTRRAR
ncbi:MAG: Wzt carbohydrate-binding domain-containing protein [Thermoanaerobaculia bacterium]|nr:Wzt carbohydrate-binding domain-containing protein [Thermoanaerobaculia bacterium]